MNTTEKITRQLAGELAVSPDRVDAAVGLLDGGATVPFIARYRKEHTGGLDDVQLRRLEERLGYLRELEQRRTQVLESIAGQQRLTPALEAEILGAATKTRLEDLYLPYRPKRRTKASIAREAGLEPLALALLEDPEQVPETAAAAYVDPDRGVADAAAALDGARQILMERFSEDAALVGQLRDYLWEHGILRSTLVAGKEQEAAKYADYFDYGEAIRQIPSHRALALFRGRSEGVLSLDLQVDRELPGLSPCELMVIRHAGIEDRGRPADAWLQKCASWTWKVKLFTRLDLELKMRLREAAEAEAIRVFAANLKDLLLAAPAGNRSILGLDPGLRTGVKVAVVDGTGKVVETATIYPHAPKRQWDGAIATLAALVKRHGVTLVSIGNGTASRETDRLVGDLSKRHPELRLTRVITSEAGASVYSASELASSELPELDVSLRGAVSIARRLQDPLAELVKIDPKAIGVGQYQHDVNQGRLARALGNVVEDCVNTVGVDVNTASPPLLQQVAGLSRTQAENIVGFRDRNGRFRHRRALLEVPRLGARSFEQAAGFLRIPDGEDPLDASAVHPEAYPVVARIVARAGRPLSQIMGDSRFLRSLDPEQFTDERFGVPTVSDIIRELDKPGRDPRGEFRSARFQEGVDRIEDLREGMVLEGVVTNVTNFGAFVDVGVHQDGLVHISALADRFVKDPREVVKTGDLVKVKVMGVEVKRRRIALSMRLNDPAERRPKGGARSAGSERRPAAGKRAGSGPKAEPAQGALAAALSGALKGK